MRKGLPEFVEAQGGLKDMVHFVSQTACPVYITEEGRPRAVMLDIDSYNALLDATESTETPVPETDVAFLRRLLQKCRTMRHHA